MRMKVVFLDNSWVVGERGIKEIGFPFPHETRGTHHFTITSGDEQYLDLIGEEIAIPISSAKYFLLNYEG